MNAVMQKNWHVGDRIADLTAVLDPDINLAIWHREVPAGLIQNLNILCTRGCFHFKKKIGHIFSDNSLDQNDLATIGLLDRENLLWQDFNLLTAFFHQLIKGRDFTFNFNTVHDSQCRYFHTDNLYLRLICTYQGAGTQWVENDQVNRNQMDGNPNLRLAEQAQIHSVETFSVAILKGESFREHFGIVHRSPPITEPGQDRVVLRLDCLQ